MSPLGLLLFFPLSCDLSKSFSVPQFPPSLQGGLVGCKGSGVREPQGSPGADVGCMTSEASSWGMGMEAICSSISQL